MASTYLTRTPSSTGTQTKFTFSFWVKITSAGNGADKAIFSSGLNSSNYYMIRFTSGDQLQILSKDNANNQINYNTNQIFRDTNAWYHIVLAHDTTQSSGSRIKYYVNGEQVSSFQSSVEPSASANILYVNDTTVHAWGRRNYNSDLYTDMVLSHVHFCDGYSYQASDFGSTDSTTGEWQINTSPSVTYGTNGYFILKDGNSVTDQSGNGNNWTVSAGTLTNTEDCPSNVFATGNPLVKGTNGNSHGNLRTTSGQNSWESMWSTLASSSGKFYAEFRRNTNNGYTMFGVRKTENITTFDETTGVAGGVGYQSHGSIIDSTVEIHSGGSPYATYADGDIIGVAMDLDNSKLYFSKNGTWQNSGDPTSGSTGTGAISLTANAIYHFGFCAYNNSADANFGNGYFGTTAVSSAGTNASGIGIFEYDVPTGYTALSTKGLNE